MCWGKVFIQVKTENGTIKQKEQSVRDSHIAA